MLVLKFNKDTQNMFSLFVRDTLCLLFPKCNRGIIIRIPYVFNKKSGASSPTNQPTKETNQPNQPNQPTPPLPPHQKREIPERPSRLVRSKHQQFRVLVVAPKPSTFGKFRVDLGSLVRILRDDGADLSVLGV